MISSDGCKQLVAGNYDVIINEPATFKSVLTDFLDRFERHENELGRPDCGYVSEFKLLKEFSKTLKENKANLQDGEMDFNQKKNRYKDIIPFSHTRVILSSNSETDPGSSYINANYICGPSGSSKAYIACQGPLACTLNDFWRMIWECNVSVIIMACNENESGKPKCELYWPDQVETSQTYGNIQVTLMRVRQINSDFLIRKFSVKLLEPIANAQQQVIDSNHSINKEYGTINNYSCVDNNHNHECLKHQQHNHQTLNHLSNNKLNGSIGNSSTSNESINTDDQQQQQQQHGTPDAMQRNRAVLMERTICQFHYTTWPDHGVPDSVHPILELVRLVREVQPAEDKPILVHCSAGCGRTGTICCIDFVWGLLRRGKLDSSFDLYRIISQMRQQRMAMVQTLEQYILCHRAVAALFMQQLQLIDNHVYENLDGTEDENDDDNNEKNVDENDEEQDLGPVFI